MKTAYINCIILDGSASMKPTTPMTVLVENGKIISIEKDCHMLSDCPFTTHYDMWRELVYFHKYVGVTNAFALYTATKRNAEILGIGDVTGSIEAGKSADFLIVDANPLEDLRALRTPYMVVACAKRFEKPKVKKYSNVETELDKWN